MNKTLKSKNVIGKRKPTVVLRSVTPYPIDKLLSTIISTSIEREKDGKVVLFMCHVAASCPSEAIKLFKSSSRMDLDPVRGTIRIWHVQYNSRKPDVVIENVVAPVSNSAAIKSL